MTKEGKSPIGGALLGHKVGEDLEIKAPGGKYKVRIISVTWSTYRPVEHSDTLHISD